MNFSGKSLNFFPRLFLCLFIAVLLEPAFFMQFVPRLITHHLGFLAWMIFFFTSVFFYSGIFGAAADLVTDTSPMISFHQIKENAKEFWRLYVGIFCIPYLVHFILFFLKTSIHVKFIQGAADGILLLVTIGLVLKQKETRFSFLACLKYLLRFQVLLIFLSFSGLIFFSGILFIHIPPDSLHRLGALLILINRTAYFALLSLLLKSAYQSNEKIFAGDGRPEIFVVDPSGSGIYSAVVYNLIGLKSGFFSIIKALTPERYRVKEFSQAQWRDDMFCSGKLVAVTCFTSNCSEAYWIAKKFKEQGSRVVIGGPHAMFMIKEALTFCDSVVLGEAEVVWEDVIRDFENGNMRKIYDGKGGEIQENVWQKILALPENDLVRLLQTGRGCRYNCDFCSISSMTNRKIRYFGIDYMLAMLKKIARPNKVYTFLDSNIYLNPERFRQIFREVIPLKIKWASSSSIDIGGNETDLKLARQSGCRDLLIGYEISDTSPEMKKGGKFSYASKYIDFTRKIHRAGIGIKASFMCGFENDSLMTLFHLWRMAWRLFPKVTSASVQTPFPGTTLGRKLFNEERIINLNWASYNCFNLVFNHQSFHPFLFNLIFPIFWIFFSLTTSRVGLLLIFIVLFY